jgi:hypothetical protein
MSSFNLSSRKRQTSTLRMHDMITSPPVDEIKWENIGNDLKLMKESSAVAIADLQNENKLRFDRIVSAVRTLYDTPDDYQQFHKLVVNEFGKMQQITPGTVGAYFGGCLASSSMSPRGCSAICAGSVPLNTETDDLNSHCEYPVFLASFKNDGFVFTQMNQSRDMERAIIYIDTMTLAKFQGLTSREKEALKSRGIEQVQLMHYMDGENINVSGWISLDVLKDRLEHIPTINHTPTNEYSSSSNMSVWIGIIVVILLIAALIAYLYNRNGAK